MTREDVRTIIRPSGGFEIYPSTHDAGFDFGSVPVAPTRSDPRYRLRLRTLGHIERLAKARFILAEKRPELRPELLDAGDPDTVRSIVLSVFASSEIEGEGISADYLEPFVAGHTEPGEHVDDELRQRLHAHRDIKDTYFWVLNQQSEPVLTYDFVLEVHRRMFQSAKPEIAGQIKDREVRIRWHRHDGVVEVPTLPAIQAEPCLRALCERASRMFRLAKENADAPMLLAAAEFACDFLAIHPFRDGNGRTARLLSTYLLESGGYHFTKIYPLDEVILDTRAEYYEALNTSQRYWHTAEEDLSPWMEYFVEAVFEQWERAFRRVRNQAARTR
ncbi:MAG: Fic family protein [Gammaproteobacteria bacterium]